MTSTASTRPRERALVDERGETTWADLNVRVNRLIHSLRAAGLQAGDSFSILSGNRREYFEVMAAATHGCWHYVPINWHWVAEEVAYVLENSGSRALFVEPRYADVAATAGAHGGQVVGVVMGTETVHGLRAYEGFLDGGSADEPDAQVLGAPMFYTSGTTGRPKGVRGTLIEVGAPVDTIAMLSGVMGTLLGLPAGGASLLAGPVYHSAQWAFSFLPLLAGSPVVMRQKFDAAEALALIDRYGITNVHLVPAQFIRLLRLEDSIRRGFTGSSLKAVWHGAAPCSIDVKRRMIDWLGPRIYEYYGATEGAIISTIESEAWLKKPGSVGRPLDFVDVLVRKDDGTEAAPEEPGQLYFRNRMGADFEYHGDPEKTSAAHLEPGVFTFGDIGYLDGDGYLYIVDRKIDMIISGGVNIYPAEIESVLVTHPAIADAAVFGVPNQEFGEEIKAAVELNTGYDPSRELTHELMAHCREHLAGYKVPRSIDFEKTLPRRPTGKLYKRLLREAYWKNVRRKI